ncbi:DUF421 domain-containing protein [Pontibacter silvestris]|uniref:DUF421 domain-containing protein n=1 Tax=Pontibacter silvestris TaxID=2305183 RepID=A0ABW4WV37_9BACT|nr:YetF domain-containing protein [Pontibacter silvestris]MCC9137745.1 DUF421 domain-containing protein [Pontibacter silvestris]
MNKDELDITNWERILIGEVPLEFMLESFFRTIIIFLFLIFILRMLGKRMNAQLTLTEMAIMLTLGAIVSPAMQIPDRGLLPAFVSLTVLLFLQQGLGMLSFRHRKVEVVTQGDVSLMVRNGVLVLEEMGKSRVSREQLFGVLRTHKIRHLGEIKRVYLESGGFFSVFKRAEPKPGLSIIPGRDHQLPQPVDKELENLVCKKCGNLVAYDENYINKPCNLCQYQEWTNPTLS